MKLIAKFAIVAATVCGAVTLGTAAASAAVPTTDLVNGNVKIPVNLHTNVIGTLLGPITVTDVQQGTDDDVDVAVK
jgi:hypothetical protein